MSLPPFLVHLPRDVSGALTIRAGGDGEEGEDRQDHDPCKGNTDEGQGSPAALKECGHAFLPMGRGFQTIIAPRRRAPGKAVSKRPVRFCDESGRLTRYEREGE
jgi:hypothetical protein